MNKSQASIHLRPTELGGRVLPISSGYVANLVSTDGQMARARVEWLGRECLDPSEASIANLEFVGPGRAALNSGSAFVLMEGEREVASGWVSEVPIPPVRSVDGMPSLAQPVDAVEPLLVHSRVLTGLSLSNVAVPKLSVEAGVIESSSFATVTVLSGTLGGIRGAALVRDCSFVDCSLDVGVMNARFERCMFRSSRLPTYLSGAEFVECRFEGQFDRLIFDGANPVPDVVGRQSNDFRSNDFHLAKLPRVAFKGIPYGDQVWPDDARSVLIDSRAVAGIASTIQAAIENESERRVMHDYVRWFSQFYGPQREAIAWVEPGTRIGQFWELCRKR